ncbi:MAG: YaaL family protein [Lachnospiraceae bacterium]|nr:YaaL family protein [Lachnospiraceae bacterium]
MKIHFSQSSRKNFPSENGMSENSIFEDIAKTRFALETAYAGFDNATDPDLIDCYIYEVNSVMKRYKYLLDQAAKMQALQTAPTEAFQAAEKRPLPDIASYTEPSVHPLVGKVHI